MESGMNPTNAFRPAPIKPIISHEVVGSIDIRVGTIERVDDVASSNKLMKLTVDEHRVAREPRPDCASRVEPRRALGQLELGGVRQDDPHGAGG